MAHDIVDEFYVNGLVLSGNKPLPAKVLPCSMMWYVITNGQWGKKASNVSSALLLYLTHIESLVQAYPMSSGGQEIPCHRAQKLTSVNFCKQTIVQWHQSNIYRIQQIWGVFIQKQSLQQQEVIWRVLATPLSW